MMINSSLIGVKAEERKMIESGQNSDMIERETMINMMMDLKLQDIRD